MKGAGRMSRVVHFEVYAKDTARALKFYESTLGWQFSKWDGPAEYWMIKTGPDEAPGINGGLMERPYPVEGEAVNAFVCTVDTTDLDALVATVTENGGTLAVPKMPVPGVGWLAY